jgi:hypothetical protein
VADLHRNIVHDRARAEFFRDAVNVNDEFGIVHVTEFSRPPAGQDEVPPRPPEKISPPP